MSQHHFSQNEIAVRKQAYKEIL